MVRQDAPVVPARPSERWARRILVTGRIAGALDDVQYPVKSHLLSKAATTLDRQASGSLSGNLGFVSKQSTSCPVFAPRL